MKNLFEPSFINSLQLSNRFIRSATWEGLADAEGKPMKTLIGRISELAKGEIGLIISGHSYVTKQGQGTPFQSGAHKDSLIPEYKKMTEAAHENKVPILLQLSHAGVFADKNCIKQPPLAVSKMLELSEGPQEEITPEGIKALINAFVQAARRAQDSGFDGIQLHAAHGYLLSQFLSPAFNQRQDNYGGSIRNRTRIHLEIYQSIRKMVGNNFPILIKMNGKDFYKNGLDTKDAIQAAKIFAETGFDAIEVSGGFVSGGKISPSCTKILNSKKESYFKKYATSIKKEVSIPIILVGGNRSLENMEQVFAQGFSDYFSMSRPFICEPNLIKRWKSGDTHKSKCVSCNLCFKPGFKGKGVSCLRKEDT